MIIRYEPTPAENITILHDRYLRARDDANDYLTQYTQAVETLLGGVHMVIYFADEDCRMCEFDAGDNPVDMLVKRWSKPYKSSFEAIIAYASGNIEWQDAQP